MQVLYDGHSFGAVQMMRGIPCLTLMHLHQPWATEQELAQYAVHRQADGRRWGNRPGNYELMLKQGEPVRQAEDPTQGLMASSMEISCCMPLSELLFCPGRTV